MSVSAPAVTVVLAARDEEARLAATLESVLSQEGPALELVAVDDGSRDRTGEILAAAAARDPRVRVVTQEPAGLTAALAHGCTLARAPFVARQDAGDRSLPGRLARLVGRLDAEPALVLVSGGTRFLGPEGEPLYEITQDDAAARAGLAAERAAELRGPSSHGVVVFRRNAYEMVGGYREAFRVAQDLDLWLRLDEVGDIGAVQEILYEARLGLETISALRRPEQLGATRLALAARGRRLAGHSETDLLSRAMALTSRRARIPRRRLAAGAYFVGCCLIRRDPSRARRYLRIAFEADPFHLRARWRHWTIRP